MLPLNGLPQCSIFANRIARGAVIGNANFLALFFAYPAGTTFAGAGLPPAGTIRLCTPQPGTFTFRITSALGLDLA